MNIVEILSKPNTISALIFLAATGIVGILVGKLRLFSIKLGIAGVLFTGILVGHLGGNIDPHVLHFVKEFGLILFVYSIGIEIGPRFLPSLKENGIKLNMLAASIIVLGVITAFILQMIFDLKPEVIAGLLTGSVTNTPSLGAIQSLIKDHISTNAAQVSGMAYAVAYPFGIMGIILSMFAIKFIFKKNIETEVKAYEDSLKSKSGNVKTVKIDVKNPNSFGKTLSFVKEALDKEFVFSRIFRDGEYLLPEDELVIKENDTLIGLAKECDFSKIELKVGTPIITDDHIESDNLAVFNVVITNRKLTGRRLRDIKLSRQFPANITRIFRSETEIIPSSDTTLEFGDSVRVIGARHRMEEVAQFLGNSQRELSLPNILPLFIGIFLGILIGSIPVSFPGLPTPAKLGLAGGPLLVALFLGHKGRIGNFNFYISSSANKFIRELGIVLFLACVGIGAGKNFWHTLSHGGYFWMLYGAFITAVPLLIVGFIASMMKINHLTITGLLAGSMTDPPALEFANSIAPVQAQASAYATVYPLTMFLRILTAQILVIVLL